MSQHGLNKVLGAKKAPLLLVFSSPFLFNLFSYALFLLPRPFVETCWDKQVGP